MNAGTKTAVVGIASTIISAIVAKVSAACPDLVAQLPVLVTTGLIAGVTLWMQSPKKPQPPQQ